MELQHILFERQVNQSTVEGQINKSLGQPPTLGWNSFHSGGTPSAWLMLSLRFLSSAKLPLTLVGQWEALAYASGSACTDAGSKVLYPVVLVNDIKLGFLLYRAIGAFPDLTATMDSFWNFQDSAKMGKIVYLQTCQVTWNYAYPKTRRDRPRW